INAGMALALTLPQVAALADESAGTTVVPTVISAGTTSNTVPAEARVDIDVRARTAAELDRVDEQIRALAENPQVEGSTTTVLGGINRPPFEPEQSAALFARATSLAAELGLPAPEGVSVGGASDGNFTAGDGIPTLDGLGAVGAGAHAEHEHAVIAEIAPRTALLAALIADRLPARPRLTTARGRRAADGVAGRAHRRPAAGLTPSHDCTGYPASRSWVGVLVVNSQSRRCASGLIVLRANSRSSPTR